MKMERRAPKREKKIMVKDLVGFLKSRNYAFPGKVLPELDGKLDGIAMRVPVPDGSVVDLNVRLEKDVTIHDVNDAVRAAADSGSLQYILHYSTLPVVSTDIIGNPHSSIFDAPFTRVVEGNFVKTLNWYDNEWGYSNRVADLLSVLHDLD